MEGLSLGLAAKSGVGWLIATRNGLCLVRASLLRHSYFNPSSHMINLLAACFGEVFTQQCREVVGPACNHCSCGLSACMAVRQVPRLLFASGLKWHT